jgi:undecaprenyl-diphosphatase
MDSINSIFLGIIQGLTEFLPISSSGHLVLGQHFLGIENSGILLEVVLHLGTLLSILLYYRRAISNLLHGISKRDSESLHYALMLAVATIPVVVAGLMFKNQLESLFLPKVVPYMFLITGCILFTTQVASESQKSITLKIAIVVGCAPALAMLPGISRSGMTISLALLLGIHRVDAAKFSFFMAIPVLLGAGILQLGDVGEMSVQVWPLFLGFLSAFISGYVVIKWLINLISNQHYWKFSYYCIFVGLICIFVGVGS